MCLIFYQKCFLNIIGLLEVDKSRNGRNLSRSPNGKLSLSITHFPAKEHERSSVNQHRSLSGLVSQEQDTTASGHQIIPPKKKRKTPAQRRRARKRFQKWLEKRKANSGTVKVAESVSTEQTADPMVLDTVSCRFINQFQEPASTVAPSQEMDVTQQDQASKQPLQDSPLDQFPSTRDSSLTSSEYDSELDSDGEYIHDQEFCANCFSQSPECTLKRCTHCILSYYCSVKCQRANWQEHKLACSVVSAQHKTALRAC